MTMMTTVDEAEVRNGDDDEVVRRMRCECWKRMPKQDEGGKKQLEDYKKHRKKDRETATLESGKSTQLLQRNVSFPALE